MPLGDRIKKAREESLRISKKELALLLGVSQSAVNQWENNVNLPSQKKLIELSRVLNVTYEWLINGTREPKSDENVYEIPFYEDIRCSAGTGYFNGESEILMISGDLIPLPSEKINKNIIMLRASGDSMEPAISDGGVVFIDTSETKIVDGKIYVYQKDDILRIKQLEHSFNGLIIKSINQNYADERVTHKDFSNICVIGRVLYSINKF
ncbi:XRE family transcriptional regulator [Vibrio cincinnatiensis]|uniref:XRE family transcriptional regulator n=1 Tax=Vibrio cincinnatiensis TaxID=675 RepID=UPI001EDE6773|nr:LexA family transcriptional regulator [Vibrio cincinnatiensis]MCG3741155.1 LexA family transcriptional regulator [Vibrio cincinnatiensis]